jgi:hypothetical protein
MSFKIYSSSQNIFCLNVVIIPDMTFWHVCEAPIGRVQILYMKCVHPHISSAQILNRKSLILFWIKGNVTPQSCNH